MKATRHSRVLLAVSAAACAVLAIIDVQLLLNPQQPRFLGPCFTNPFTAHQLSLFRDRAIARVAARAGPGALTRSIKQAETLAELWAIAASLDCNLIHRATILFALAEMVKTSRDPTLSGSIAGANEFRHLLKGIVEDLPSWKSSGALKVTVRAKDEVIAQQAQYLGNIIWALGELKQIISDTLPVGEETILFENAVLAALEGIPDFMRVGCVVNVCQMIFGLREVGRSLQCDALFSTIAQDLMENIEKHSSEQQREISSSLLSFGHYGLTDPGVTQFFLDAKGKLSSKNFGPELLSIVNSVAGYAMYAHRCANPADDPINFAVSLVKRNGQKLGIKMDSVRGQHGLLISKVTEGSVRRWNRRHPQWTVMEGDRIVNANGVDGTAKQIADEITSKQSITMLLKRGRVAVQVRDRSQKDVQVPYGIRDVGMMQELGKRLVTSLAQEENEQERIKCISRTIQSYIVLGIRCETLFEFVAKYILKYSHRLSMGHTCRLLWGLGKMDIGGPSVVDALVRHAVSLVQKSRIEPCDMPVMYHVLKKFGYSDGSSEIVALQNAARRQNMTIADLQEGDATPPFWA